MNVRRLAVLAAVAFLCVCSALADNTPQTLPFSQDWTNTGLITADDNWSGVPGIIGYRGDSLTGSTGVNPQTVLGEGTLVVDVNANQLNPNTFTTGGVAEFHIANPVVALQGSGTARAPYIQIHLNTTGKTNITVAYNLRDIDGSADNAVQPVALQFRVGSSGNFTNIPSAFVSDASTGPSLATLVTAVSATLPAAAENQPLVEIRIITTDAVGSDEWIGIDDISITGSTTSQPTNPAGVGSASPSTVVAGTSTLLSVSVNPGTNPTSTGIAVTADLTSIGGSSMQTFAGSGNTFTYQATVPLGTLAGAKTVPVTITDDQGRIGAASIALTVEQPAGAANHVVISQIYPAGGNSGATYKNDYVELYNPTDKGVSLAGWTLQYTSAAGSTWGSNTQPLGGTIAPHAYFLIALAAGNGGTVDLPIAPITGTIAMGASAGKVALVDNSIAYTVQCPVGDAHLVDFVGYGSTANCHEGSANAPAPSSLNAIFRKDGGATDTDNNGSDFVTGTPDPRGGGTPIELGPRVTGSDPSGLDAPHDASITVFFSEGVEVSGNWYDIRCGSVSHNDASVAHTTDSKEWVITPNVNFAYGDSCTFTIFAANVRDLDTIDTDPNTDYLFQDYVGFFTVTAAVPPPYPRSMHALMGKPDNADIMQPDDNKLLETDAYTLSYNRIKGTPNWVSWHLSTEWTIGSGRTDTFRPDPAIPPVLPWYRVQAFDFFTTGFDRGHMAPSADRDASAPMNHATFLMTNMVPQAHGNNAGPWEDLESHLRLDLTPANELYVIAGPAGVGGTGSNGFMTSVANGNVTVPAYTWKVALVLPRLSTQIAGDMNDVDRVSAATHTIAVIMPNDDAIAAEKWTKYVTTVRAVEQLTGYNFFSNVPKIIQNSIEAGTDGQNPPGVDDQSLNATEDVAAGITLNAVSPDANAAYAYTTSLPAHGSLSGTGPAFTYTPAGDFNGNDSFTFSVNDGHADSNTSTVSIHVAEVNDAPIANADAAQVEAGASVEIPASSLATNDAAGPANEAGQSLTVTSVSAATHGSVAMQNGVITFTPDVPFSGAATFAYEVCDNGTTAGGADPKCTTGTVNVTVVDTKPPVIDALSTNTKQLWPANHKMADVKVDYGVTDRGDSAPQCSLSVLSNEPADGLGDGDTAPDWIVVDAHHLQLRAERSALGTGRVYTITATCADRSGNTSSATTTVTVPLNQR